MNSFFSRALACAFSLSVSLSLLPSAAAEAAPDASGAPASCPEVVVVAARGSDQNEEEGEYFGPQRYSEHSAPSNGFEGPNFTAFFRQVEARHPGTMDHVYVLALDDAAYPATMQLPPLAQEGEQLNPVQVVQRLAAILGQYPLGQLLHSVTFGFLDSVKAGMANAPKIVDNYEATTGCHPAYITAGYSQGALITTSLEGHLAQTGRLHASLTIGNPLTRPGGIALPAANLLPRHADLPAGRRLNYCLSGDFVCGFNAASASAALATKAARHASYFKEAPTPADAAANDAVVDTFAGWVEGARSNRGE